MPFSQTTEYALRAVVCLAQHPQTPLPTQQIADLTRVPASYLSKVLQALRRGKIVAAIRGIHGGFVLHRQPDALTVLDVINAIDPLQRIRTCPLELASHGTNLCPLHRRLDDAIAMVQAAMAETTIQALLDEPSASVPLRESPIACGDDHQQPTMQRNQKEVSDG